MNVRSAYYTTQPFRISVAWSNNYVKRLKYRGAVNALGAAHSRQWRGVSANKQTPSHHALRTVFHVANTHVQILTMNEKTEQDVDLMLRETSAEEFQIKMHCTPRLYIGMTYSELVASDYYMRHTPNMTHL